MKLPKLPKPKKILKILKGLKPNGIEALIACGLVVATAVAVAVIPKSRNDTVQASSEITVTTEMKRSYT